MILSRIPFVRRDFSALKQTTTILLCTLQTREAGSNGEDEGLRVSSAHEQSEEDSSWWAAEAVAFALLAGRLNPFHTRVGSDEVSLAMKPSQTTVGLSRYCRSSWATIQRMTTIAAEELKLQSASNVSSAQPC